MDLNDYEKRRIVTGDLDDALFAFKHRTHCSMSEARRAVYSHWREMKGLPEPTEKFVGCYDDDELPIKPGDMVTIKKGTLVRSLHHGNKPAGRTYKVKVDHILNGTTTRRNHRGEEFICTNPSIRWAGTGGYWSTVDINDIPEAVDA